MTERNFQNSVVSIAKMYGWLVFHDYDSRRSTPGFPDLVMVRPPRVVVVEIKVGAQVTSQQHEWLELLAACGVEAYVWYPSDAQMIADTLKR